MPHFTAPSGRAEDDLSNEYGRWSSSVEGGTARRVVDPGAPAVDFAGVSFSYPPAPRHHADQRSHKLTQRGSFALRDVTLRVPRGARVVLVGENGAGKSSLLETIAGQHKPLQGRAQVLGLDAFNDTMLNGHITFVGAPWPPEVSWGATVEGHLALEKDTDPAHVNAVMRALHVDPRWRIDRISAGQKRRVQLLLGFLRRRDLLCLDECSTDIDVVERHTLLSFFRAQSEQHGTTVLYATHIFDGLDGWATHVVRMVGGRVVLEEALPAENPRGALYRRALAWILEDKAAAVQPGAAAADGDDDAPGGKRPRCADGAAGGGEGAPPRRGDVAVRVRGLDYDFPKRQGGAAVFRGAECDVPAGARVLVVGTNGSGKSTLLRILAGRRLVHGGAATVHGRDAFGDTKLMDTVAFSGDWWANPPDYDMSVAELLSDPAAPRTRHLLGELNVDLDWDLKRVSAGQRRRIQLLLALEARRRVLLLDEVTSDMDVVQRGKFLRLLRDESEGEDPATVLYCTHIFEGLDGWATHLLVVDGGAQGAHLSAWDPAADTLLRVHELLSAHKDVEWAAQAREIARRGAPAAA